MFPNSELHQCGRHEGQPQKNSESDSQHWGQQSKKSRRTLMALSSSPQLIISALRCNMFIYVINSAFQVIEHSGHSRIYGIHGKLSPPTKPGGNRPKNIVLKYPVADSPYSN